MTRVFLAHLLPHAAGKPTYGTPGAAGMDLVAAVAEDLVILPGATALVPTGLVVALPEHTELQVRPRSGLALKHGISVLNTPGTVDSDYRGEVGVILINHGKAPFTVKRGDRIAQAVIAPVIQADFTYVASTDHLGTSCRGTGGYGSTGR